MTLLGMDRVTLRLVLPDGSVHEEEVSLDFSEVSPVVLQEAAEEFEAGASPMRVTARLVAEQLSVDIPVEVLEDFLEGLERGEGVITR